MLREGQFSRIEFPGAAFTGAAMINERGDTIVGRYQNADGAFHGFLLTGFRPANPCPAGN